MVKSGVKSESAKNESANKEEDEEVPDHFQQVPDKALADVIEALIGVFYDQNRSLQEAHVLMHGLGVLKYPFFNV